MATPTIPNGEEHFFPIIYEGNGAGQRVGKFVPFTDNGTIPNSLIFNHPDEPELSRTPSSGGNRRTFTISAWVKLASEFGQRRMLFSQAASGNIYFLIEFNASNQLFVSANDGSAGADLDLVTNRTFEDTSKFYHITLAVDTTQSTASDRVKLYVDGDQITSFATATYFGQNYDTQVNHTVEAAVGNWISTGYATDGYIAEFNLVDGTALTPDTFGLTDTSTGRWIPKALTGITYGTNGFRLQFGSSSALGDDTSGNTNDFSVTNLLAGDQTTDSPTQNHATFSPSFSSSSMLLSEGNLTVTDNANANYESAYVGMPVQSGKYYFEITMDVAPQFLILGVNNLTAVTANKNQFAGYADGSAGFLFHTTSDSIYYGGNNYINAGSATTLSNGDKVAVAYDADTGAFWVAKNNSWLYSGNPSTGANPLFSGITAKELVYFSTANWYSTVKQSYNFGQKSFTYTPPTGFVALQQDNLPETDRGIVGLTWIKDRDNAYSGGLRDSSRGRHKDIFSNLQQAEVTNTDGVQKFLKGGIQIEDLTGLNASGASIVSWNWVANGGVTSTNNNGSITSTVQANTTAGFSIVQYTGTGSAGTVGHGLSSTPEWFIIKSRSVGTNWYAYHKSMGATYQMYLNLNYAKDTSVLTAWNDTAPTSSVISLAPTGYGSNNASATYVIYAWHGVEGFSKFGSYTGNGSTNGPFVYTGFKPAWIMIKQTNSTGSWIISDNKRNIFNPIDKLLRAEGTNTESTFTSYDMLSNGFKQRNTDTGFNGSGSTYIYMAFAEHPFVGDGTNPVTAR